MELSEADPIFGENDLLSEYLVEDHPGHYVSANYAQYGVYDYDTGEALPEGHKVVRRYYKGNILIVFKQGPYNGISSTYDGSKLLLIFPTSSEPLELVAKRPRENVSVPSGLDGSALPDARTCQFNPLSSDFSNLTLSVAPSVTAVPALIL